MNSNKTLPESVHLKAIFGADPILAPATTRTQRTAIPRFASGVAHIRTNPRVSRAMAEMYGTFEYDTGGLEGLADYLRQRANGLKPRKRDVLLGYARIAENAADRIVRLEHFKATALKLEKEAAR